MGLQRGCAHVFVSYAGGDRGNETVAALILRQQKMLSGSCLKGQQSRGRSKGNYHSSGCGNHDCSQGADGGSLTDEQIYTSKNHARSHYVHLSRKISI